LSALFIAGVIACSWCPRIQAQQAAREVAQDRQMRPLRYGTDSLHVILDDPTHPLYNMAYDITVSGALPSDTWRALAQLYAKEGDPESAWQIELGLLRKYACNQEQFSEKGFSALVSSLFVLPPRSKEWRIEEELYGLFADLVWTPHASTVFAQLLRELNTLNKVDEAAAICRRVLEHAPDASMALAALDGMPPGEELYREIAEAYRDAKVGLHALRKLAGFLENAGRLNEAASSCLELIKRNPPPEEIARALRSLIQISEMRQDYMAAISYAEQLGRYAVGEECLALITRIGTYNLRLGRPEAYVKTYLEAARQCGAFQPASAAGAILEGAARAEEDGWLPEASDLYELAGRVLARSRDLSLDDLPPSGAPPEIRIAFWKRTLPVPQDPGPVEDTVRLIAETYPASREAAWAYYCSARAALTAGDPETGLLHARKLAVLLPEAHGARSLLAEAEGLGARQRDIERVLTSESDLTPEGVYNLGRASLGSADYAEAVARFETLVDTWPQSPLAPRALYDAALAYRDHIQDAGQAQATLERLMILYPDTDLATRAYRLLHSTRAR
jgi:tetratricopeptide (TPR) repeat protein